MSSSSTGLSSTLAAPLAYAGWWITGLIFWWLERDDKYVRFHAAQSTAAFGLISLIVAGFLFLAVASLSFLPQAFTLFVWAAALLAIAGMAAWGKAIWAASKGENWRMPIAAELADRLVKADGPGPMGQGLSKE